METKTFVPKIIGENAKLEYEITDTLLEIGDVATGLKKEMESFFECPVSVKDLIDFVSEKQANNAKKWILSKWVILKEIEIKGISTEKLIENNMIDIPDHTELCEMATNVRKLFDNQKPKYGLHNLSEFLTKTYIDEAFYNLEPYFDLIELLTVDKTANQLENVAIDSILKVCEGLTELVFLGILKPKLQDISKIIELLKIQKDDVNLKTYDFKQIVVNSKFWKSSFIRQRCFEPVKFLSNALKTNGVISAAGSLPSATEKLLSSFSADEVKQENYSLPEVNPKQTSEPETTPEIVTTDTPDEEPKQ